MAETDLIAPTTIRVAVAKPKFGIYYALLIVSLFAMLGASLMMYLFIRANGGFGTVKGKVATIERPATLFVAKC